jgi:hypothetical protein
MCSTLSARAFPEGTAVNQFPDEILGKLSGQRLGQPHAVLAFMDQRKPALASHAGAGCSKIRVHRPKMPGGWILVKGDGAITRLS